MIKKVNVKIFNQRVGEVFLQDGLPFLKFDEEFLKGELDLSPIMLPLSKLKSKRFNAPIAFEELNYNGSPFFGIAGFIADSLPDKFGNELIEEWIAKIKKSKRELTVLERLSYVGDRGMGALEFEPVIENQDFSIQEDLNIGELFEIVEKILNKKNSLDETSKNTELSIENIKQIISVGTSAGGARSKAIIAIKENEDGTLTIKSGANKDLNADYRHFLIKFDSALNKDKEDSDGVGHTNVEYGYYLMAKDAKIDMAFCHLIQQGKLSHFITERFDRFSNKETGKIEKIQMTTLCGLLHSDFNKSREIDYKDIFEVIDRISIEPLKDKEDLFKRVVFNVVGRNQDDHTKNFSFLMNKKGEWRLSPFYDVSFAYNPNGKWTSKHQITILGQSKNELIDRELLIELGKNVGLTENYCVAVIEQVNKVFENFEDYMLKAGVKPERALAMKQELHFLPSLEREMKP